jgi:ribosomal-protein-alanine N-acetyltransferase
MLTKLVGKLSNQRRTRIMLEVRETNLSAQVFFRHNGFRAISVLREFYEDTPEDAYIMEYWYQAPDMVEQPVVNRIARLAG